MPRPTDVVFPRKERFEDRRREGEQRKLRDEFFDHRTLRTIAQLVTQGQFDVLDHPVSTGKEGGVFRASGGEGFRAVKVYRIGNTIFRRLPPYTLAALRRETSARNFTGLIYAWTRREHTILRRLRAAGVRVPEPFGYLHNVLVMEFVGHDGIAAPRLVDAVVDDPERLHRALVAQFRRMVVDARIVHGDLSPYNVLWDGAAPVVIDVAQSLAADHPAAPALLRRDAEHFARYLKRLGADVDPMAFFAAIGGPSVGPAP